MSVFLATTALTDFWDKRKKIVLLGDWCLNYKIGKVNEETAYEILEYNWEKPKALHEACCYYEQLCERSINELALVLNEIHKTDYSIRYWEILIGPWLYILLAASYDRYKAILSAKMEYPGFSTILLDEECYITPRDTNEFNSLIKEDRYNLQLISFLMRHLDYHFPTKKIENRKLSISASQNGSLKTRCSKSLKSVITSVSKFVARQSSIILQDTYLPFQVRLALMFRSRFRIIPVFGRSFSSERITLNHDKRAIVGQMSLGEGEFEKILPKLISEFMPLCFLEHYKQLDRFSSRNYPINVGGIVSANAWYYDEPFKFWAAKSAANGAKLIGIQHGGVYGQVDYTKSEKHELSITDHYLTWGWKDEVNPEKTVPISPPKLLRNAQSTENQNKTKILWTSTLYQRYLACFVSCYDRMEAYTTWQSRFFANLDKEIRDAIIIRPHRENSNLNQIRSFAKEVPIETWDIPFYESLRESRVFVCDHLSTTYLEALVQNQPTILFWPDNKFLYKASSRIYFDQLISAKILHTNPESAAFTLNHIYNNPEEWWNDPNRQQARNQFVEEYANVARDYKSEWLDKLISLIPEPDSY